MMYSTSNKNWRILIVITCIIIQLPFLSACVWKGLCYDPREIRSYEQTLQWKVDVGYMYSILDPLRGHFLDSTDVYNVILYKRENQGWTPWMTLDKFQTSRPGEAIPPSFLNLSWSKDKCLFVSSNVGRIGRNYSYGKGQFTNLYVVTKIYKVDLSEKKVVSTSKFAFFSIHYSHLVNQLGDSLALLKSNGSSMFVIYEFMERTFKLVVIPEDLSEKTKCFKLMEAGVNYSQADDNLFYNARLLDDNTIRIEYENDNGHNERIIKLNKLNEENCSVE